MEGADRDFRGTVPTGEFGVIKRGANGEAKPLAFSGAGVLEEEISLIDGKTRIATCVAPEPTDIAASTRDAISDLLVRQPSMDRKILLIPRQVASQRLRATSAGRYSSSAA